MGDEPKITSGMVQAGLDALVAYLWEDLSFGLAGRRDAIAAVLRAGRRVQLRSAQRFPIDRRSG